MLPNHDVVRDLDEVIDFCTCLDPGPAEPGAINGSVGSDFNVIVDLNDAHLWNFLVLAFDKFEPEAVRSNDDTAVNDHPGPDASTLSNCDPGIDETGRSNRSCVTDVSSRAENGVVPYFRAGFDHDVRLNGDSFAQLRSWIDDRARMNSRRIRNRFGAQILGLPARTLSME